MTCRDTKLGSAMTSFAKITEGIEEYQSLGMFHEIMTPASAQTAGNADQALVAEFVDSMIETVRDHPSLTRARKRSLIERLNTARTAPVEFSVYYAAARIKDRTILARQATDQFHNRAARELGESVSMIRARMAASYEESKRERSLEAPAGWKSEFLSRPGNRNLPMDRHTAYALWRMDTEMVSRTAQADTHPAVTNHRRVPGTGVSSIGYDPTSGRLEVEMRSRQGVYHAYRDVPAELGERLMNAEDPTAIYNAEVRRGGTYSYATQAEADAAGVVRRCATCGQFANAAHACAPRGSAQEEADMMARAAIQRRVVRARAAVASGSRSDRIAAAMTRGLTMEQATGQIDEENRLADLAPETALTTRTEQRLQATQHPYRGDSGTFYATALSTVRRIVDSEGQAYVPVQARISRVAGPDGRAVDAPHGVGLVSGRVRVYQDGGQYAVEGVDADTARHLDGDGARELRCECPDYQARYDCEHVRQLVADMNRRVNQEFLRDRHAIADAVAQVQAVAEAEHVVAEEARVTRQEAWAAGADEVSYTGEGGMAAFQAEYNAARERIENGEAVVEFRTENATDGLGDPTTGRGFGVEIEFDFPPGTPYDQQNVALSRMAREFYEAGLIDEPRQGDYGEAGLTGYRNNSFEHDASCAGEFVTKVLHDTPESWEIVAKACQIMNRNGAVATARTGSHVHVSTADYGTNVANHQRLLGLYKAHEDELYRVGSDPGRRQHRISSGSQYASPNPVPAEGYASTVRNLALSNTRPMALNMMRTARGGAGSRVEFRIWDGSLQPGVIQAQVAMSLAMVDAASRDDQAPVLTTQSRLGSHHGQQLANYRAGRTLTGEDWQTNTEGVRRLADTLFRRGEDKARVAALFAATKWSRTGASARMGA